MNKKPHPSTETTHWPAAEDYASRYGLSEVEEAWRQRARTFARERLAPIARDMDREGCFAPDLVTALGDEGLLGATLPSDWGGGDASTLAGCLIAEEVGAVDGSVRGFLAVQIGLVASTLAELGTADQKATWLGKLTSGHAIGCYALTEEGAGSDVGAIALRARRDKGEMVLDGEKIWITNGGVADVALVFATIEPEARHRGLECYLVPTDTEGLTRLPMEGRELGHRASDHARLVFDGVRVPRKSRLGGEREGFGVAMKALGVGRLNVAAGAVGIHRACLEASVEFARHRRQFGRRVGDFQQIGAALADTAVELETSRLLVHHAARLRDRGLEDTTAMSAAKLHATEAALRATQQALRIHGSRGYTDEVPVERHHRDALGLVIYEGTSHVQRLILARRLLGRDKEKTR